MILVKPSFEIYDDITPKLLEKIEDAGRLCYKSEAKKGTSARSTSFVSSLVKSGHESVIEHVNITVKFIVDRGVSHELVRHRLASYSQESTRYCNYKDGVTFVIPPWVSFSPGVYTFLSDNDKNPMAIAEIEWFKTMLNCEDSYMRLLEFNWSPQQARLVLPNSLKTEIMVTANLREWRHILKLRTSQSAHLQIREVMVPLLRELNKRLPVIFSKLE